jgi:hypothetical protein
VQTKISCHHGFCTQFAIQLELTLKFIKKNDGMIFLSGLKDGQVSVVIVKMCILDSCHLIIKETTRKVWSVIIVQIVTALQGIPKTYMLMNTE